MTSSTSATAWSAHDVTVLLRAATSAPSLHNTQPWQFAVVGDTVELYLDRERAVPAADPQLREVIISCGAALSGLALAVAQLGHQPRLRRFPVPHDDDHLADVLRGPAQATPAEVRRRFEALGRRRMYRRPFAARAVRDAVVTDLLRQVRGHGTWAVRVETTAQRRLVAETAGDAARHLLADQGYREELAAWTRRDFRHADGLALPLLGEAAYPVNGVPWALLGDPAVDEDSFDRDVLVLLGSSADTPRDWLAAGEALMELLLAIVRRGLAASLLTQALEVADSRDRLVQGLRLPGPPQALLRIGYPEGEVPPSSRRPVAEVLRNP